MSGICGLYALDGSAPSLSEIEIMIAPLERRGPDGTKTWQSGPIAFGQALLATTPEALVESLPLTDPSSGCTIIADVRLDNREDLIPDLGLSRETRIIGDGELILRSYLRWEGDCPEHLLGDFAFAIWDPRSEQLFAARDHMGMRQLTYHYEPGKTFAFATEPVVLLTQQAIPRQINESRIADFLDNLEAVDLTSTFFDGLLRLPPAHCLTLDVGGLAIRRYWKLRPEPELKLGSDAAYEYAFVEVFKQAVRCRLRSAGPVGAMLSGGVDSGSVAAIASTILAADRCGPLPTFSAVSSDPASCVETRAIHAALEMPGITPELICHADLGAYREDLLRLTQESGEPFDGQMTLIRAVYLAARRAGIKVVLDGVGGDLALASDAYVARLLRRGRLVRAWREARGERRFWGPLWPFWRAFLRGAWRAFSPRPLRTAKRHISWHLQDRRIGRSTLVGRRLAERTRLRDRRRAVRIRNERSDQLDSREKTESIQHPNLIVSRERYDRVAASLAIEPRDPFMDLRLIRFCLSLPHSQLQRDGWPKSILRRAMHGKMPERVLWRPGKEHLGWDFSMALFSNAPSLQTFSEGMREAVTDYANIDRVKAAQTSSPGSTDFAEWTEIVYLVNWLESATVYIRATAAGNGEGIRNEGRSK